MKIAFLGLGKMGVPLVKRLLQTGHTVSAWNRTPKSSPKSLKELGISGARIAPSIKAAVGDCEVAFTMLADDAATEAVAFGENGMIAALPRDSVHIALGTLGVALSKRLDADHRQAGQHFVAAPVFGRPNVATEGKLWIVAAGELAIIERVRPVLKELGRGLTVVGEKPWQANAFKLAGNFMITSMVQTLSEVFVFAASNGIDPELFLETVNEALFQSPFYGNYGRIMLHPPEQPGATVQLGAKDTRLFREAAAAARIQLGLADYFQQQFNASIDAGMGLTDWAVGQHLMAEKTAKKI